jgi:RNase adaptor protein for sRNA GlmZ degradation
VKSIRVILISGVSGSGKTAAIKALEDIGLLR